MKRAVRKIMVTVLACVGFAMAGHAVEPARGYRGFVDLENTIGNSVWFSTVDGCDHRSCHWMAGIATSHGYQFNNHIFLGAGLAVVTSGNEGIIPVFANFRYDYSHGKFRVFGDARVGYNFCDGYYLSPTVGYRLNWGRKVNINFGAGVTVCGKHENVLAQMPTDANGGYVNISKKRNYADTFFTLRIGVDF